jgi:hypothetical protein
MVDLLVVKLSVLVDQPDACGMLAKTAGPASKKFDFVGDGSKLDFLPEQN